MLAIESSEVCTVQTSTTFGLLSLLWDACSGGDRPFASAATLHLQYTSHGVGAGTRQCQLVRQFTSDVGALHYRHSPLASQHCACTRSDRYALTYSPGGHGVFTGTAAGAGYSADGRCTAAHFCVYVYVEVPPFKKYVLKVYFHEYTSHE